MNTLETTQNLFLDALFQKQSNEPYFIASIYPAERLAIYRRTILDNLCNALAITFPGIWKLLGDESANQLAYLFCEHNSNLPADGCLDNWGAHFPNFLGQRLELENLAYIKDYAAYEWLKQLAYCAPSSQAIHWKDLQAISEEKIESLLFTFSPTVFTLSSEFSLDMIEELIESPEADALTLGTSKVYAIIARPVDSVQTFWVEEDLWVFICALQKELSFSQALAQTHDQYPDFDLTNALHFLLENKIVANIYIPIHSTMDAIEPALI